MKDLKQIENSLNIIKTNLMDKKEIKVIFKIKGYVNFTVNFYGCGWYFATSATGRGCAGQCQDLVLEGLAMAFYKRYDKFHTNSMNSIELDNILNDLIILMNNYNYIITKQNYYNNIEIKKEKSLNIGSLVDSGLTLVEILDKINLNNKLILEMPFKIEKPKRLQKI